MNKPHRLLLLAGALVAVAIVAHNGAALVPAALAFVLWCYEARQ